MKRPFATFLLILSTALFAAAQSSDDFFITDSIREIRITFPVENWTYYLDSLRLNGDDFLEGTIEAHGFKFDGAGVQYTASRAFSPGSLRNGLTIKLNNKIRVANLQGHRSLYLSPALRDPSMVREVLGYEIARTYMPAPKANYVKVYINDSYYGLFVNVEGVDERPFLRRNFDNSRAAVFIAKKNLTDQAPEGCRNGIYGALEYEASTDCYEYNFELRNNANPERLLQLAKTLEEEPAKAGQFLDLDKTLWWLAFNNLTVNLNSYLGKHSTHYALCEDKEGKLAPVPMDLNLAFGSYKNTGEGSDLRTRQLISLDPMLHADNPYKPLLSKLLASENNRKIYLAHYRTIFNDWFKSGKYEARARELQQLIRPALKADQNWAYTLEDFDESLEKTIGKQSKIPGIVQLMSKRIEFLKKNGLLDLVAPVVEEVNVAHRKPMSKDTIENFRISVSVSNLPQEVWLYYKPSETQPYSRMKMADDGKHHDGTAGDGVFGAVIEPQGANGEIWYYIVAENAGALAFYPSQYMREPLHVTLAELNK
ncbi:MAG: hypothetical protein Kow0027_03830 [Saprospiraceae bacterium]